MIELLTTSLLFLFETIYIKYRQYTNGQTREPFSVSGMILQTSNIK